MKYLRSTAIVVFLLSQFAHAQSRTNNWDSLKQLKPGQKIEVMDMNGKSIKGEFVAFSADEISFVTGKSGMSILRANVRSVKNREKNRRVRNGIVGGLLGGAGGGSRY